MRNLLTIFFLSFVYFSFAETFNTYYPGDNPSTYKEIVEEGVSYNFRIHNLPSGYVAKYYINNKYQGEKKMHWYDLYLTFQGTFYNDGTCKINVHDKNGDFVETHFWKIEVNKPTPPVAKIGSPSSPVTLMIGQSQKFVVEATDEDGDGI